MNVKQRIEQMSKELTSTEQRLSSAILADYPFAGLQPINEFAQNLQTSPPTISRFVTKLGFSGYQEFQRQLINELKEGQRSPIELKDSSVPVEGDYLNGFLNRVETLVEQTKNSLSEAQFNRVCKLLSASDRRVFIIGNRMSDPIALYFFRHLRQIRSKVYHIPSDPEEWPEYLLRIRPKDILVIVDFRRYQERLCELAKHARTERNAHVVLITDPWFSPIASWSKEVLALPVGIDTFWDCYASAFAVIEAMFTYIAESNWDETKDRMESWDSSRKWLNLSRDE
ncbi:MurR/RpiR family transcriptional regulator [Vibrio sp. EA2]|uniref:MurR/RpiR family transcriptional regulator n=1 Tax=Vibrio sp. EA2 TaxID=3079860 RepID=UPI002948C53A|nr:MurR/RpiR family transcriptional regulator [Vibrio sp. EA2]MDV6250531.1 MurR/RpiR family transcriptional regulator [Vibrio sp. EA2]